MSFAKVEEEPKQLHVDTELLYHVAVLEQMFRCELPSAKTVLRSGNQIY